MKYIRTLILIFLSLALLSSCSSEDNMSIAGNAQNDNASAVEAEESDINENIFSGDSSDSFSSYISGRQSIWYIVDDSAPAKDSIVNSVIVLNGDGTCYAYGLGLKLGELEKMDDAEIAEAVTSSVNNSINDYFEKRISELTACVENTEPYISEIYNAIYSVFNYDNFSTKDMVSFEAVNKLVTNTLPYLDDVSEETKSNIIDSISNMCLDILENEFNFFIGPDEGKYVFKIFDEWAYEDPIYLMEANEFTEEVWNDMEQDYTDGGRSFAKTYEEALAVFKPLYEIKSGKAEIPQEYIQAVSDMLHAQYDSEIENLKQEKNNISSASYEVAIYTDRTGNNTEREEITIKHKIEDINYSQYMSYQFSPVSKFLNSEGSETYSYQIYDSLFGGFKLTGGGYLLTRVNSDKEFLLDEVGTDGIIVDP